MQARKVNNVNEFPLLIESVSSAILDEVRAGLDAPTRSILNASPLGKRMLTYLAECYLADTPVSILSAVAACEAWPSLQREARERDPLHITSEDFPILDALGSREAKAVA